MTACSEALSWALATASRQGLEPALGGWAAQEDWKAGSQGLSSALPQFCLALCRLPQHLSPMVPNLFSHIPQIELLANSASPQFPIY